jgi:hypothetical protein
MVFFGCAFIAFGPACAMFAITVAGDAQQVIVLITRSVDSSSSNKTHCSRMRFIDSKLIIGLIFQ